MLDVVLYDIDGAYCPPGLSEPVGGSEVELYQLADGFNRAGLSCDLVVDRRVVLPRCRNLIYWRQVPDATHLTGYVPHIFVRATDHHETGFRQRFGLTTVCVSKWQAAHIETPTLVIPPMLGRHVYDAAESRNYSRRDQWIYASAANKGLEDTLVQWDCRPEHLSLADLNVMTTGYDDPEPGQCVRPHVRSLGRLSPVEMVFAMSACEGMFYRNRAPETFGCTTAIAVALGLKLDIECVGHEPCGLAESRVPQDLTEKTIIARWLEILK